MTALRLRSGRARKAARGGFAYGSPPFGWRAESGELAEDASEQPALHRIRELRAEGRSLRYVARTIEAEGCQPKRSDRWHPETVRKIIAKDRTAA